MTELSRFSTSTPNFFACASSIPSSPSKLLSVATFRLWFSSSESCHDDGDDGGDSDEDSGNSSGGGGGGGDNDNDNGNGRRRSSDGIGGIGGK